MLKGIKMRTGKFHANNKGVDPNPEDEERLTPKGTRQPSKQFPGGNLLLGLCLAVIVIGALIFIVILARVWYVNGFDKMIELLRLRV